MKMRFPTFISDEFQYCCCENIHREEFLRSQWQEKSRSVWFLIYRWILALFFTGALIFSLSNHIQKFSLSKLGYFFIYLTNWGLILCTICTMYGAILIQTWYNKAKYCVQSSNESDSLPKSFGIYWSLHNIALILSILITLMYWLVIYDREKDIIDAKNILSHILNTLAMFIDLILVGHPVRLVHAIQPLIFGAVYGIFTIVYFKFGGLNLRGETYIYRVLNWQNTLKSTYVFAGVMTFGLILHILMFFIYKFRVLMYNFIVKEKKIQW